MTLIYATATQNTKGEDILRLSTDKQTWEVKTEDDLDEFVINLIKQGLNDITFTCSSSINFPDESISDQVIICLIESLFHS